MLKLSRPSFRTPIVAVVLMLIGLLLLSACAAPSLPSGSGATGQGAATPVVETAAPTANTDTGQPAAGSDVRSKGAADAKVTIVEYSDYQCPFCSRWIAETYPTILKDYIDAGKVRLEFRDFPLESIHPNAKAGAVAARCAGEENKYFAMHDKLFGGQNDWASLSDPSEKFKGYAKEIGLDEAAFAACLTSGKFDQSIAQDLQAGQAAGVTGTPSFVVNGSLIVGAQPLSVFKQALDTLLAGGTLAQPTAVAQGPQPTPAPVNIPTQGAPVKGDPNAPMTIVEYSDFQCPFCSRFTVQTLPTLLKEYIDTGKAKMVFKDFPLQSIHPNAEKAAEAARCVRELGKGDDAFWAMHDKLFASQAEWASSAAADAAKKFSGYAAAIGVDAAAFDTCLASGKHAAGIQTDLNEGIQFGVQGTPSFFLDGQIFVGAQPIENFRQAIAMVQKGLNIVPTPAPTATPEPTPAPLTEDIPLDNAAGIKGDPKAPVVIVEYTDYQCPYCQRHFSQVWPRLQSYIDEGKVLYALKDFPLSSIHPQAEKAAEAARCAGEQKAYWEMHELLFSNQQQWAGQEATAVNTFKSFAGQLKLDQATFDKCLDSGKYAEAINATLQEGVKYGVRGTPGFYINRQPLPGAYPFEAFQQLIEAALAAKQ